MKHLLAFGLILAASTEFISPNADGGFTVVDPFDPTATVIGTPTGNGGYVLTKPFDPAGTTYVTPDGAGGFISITPLGGDD